MALALTSGPFSISDILGSRAPAGAAGPEPAPSPRATPVQQAQERLTGIEKQIGQTQQEAGQFAATQQEFEARQKADAARQQAELVGQERQAIEGSEAYKSLEQISKEAAEARFQPSQRTAQENMALFGLINVLGFAIGAGGKGNAMQALSAMNGMVEGVRKGDMDKYTREKDVFNTNLKALHDKSQMLATQVKRITELAARDKEKARLEFEALQAEQGADFVKQYASKFGLPATLKYLEQQAKGAERMLQMAQQAETREQARVQEAQARIEREQERIRGLRELQDERLRAQRENMLFRLDVQRDLQRQRAAEAEERAKAKGEAKGKLQDKDVRQLEAYDSIAQGLEELKRTFKDEYASMGILGFGAELSAEAKRRIGDKASVEAMSWWSKYEQLQAPNRHALFGATLTGNELQNYRSFTAKKSDAPEMVKSSLNQQIEYSRGQGELKRDLFRGANKEVPSFPTRNYFGTFAGSAQPPATPTGMPRQLSPQDQQALDWANSNPNDPRSLQIKQRLGVQ